MTTDAMLYESRTECHAAMLQTVEELLEDIKTGAVDCPYPSERLFVGSMKRLWLEVWSKHCPTA